MAFPIDDQETLQIYTDGASRGNPGNAAYGFVFTAEGHDVFYSDAGFIGKTTNNRAEYTAAINALEKAREHHDGQVELYSDSQLLVNQLNNKWNVKNNALKELYNQVQAIIDDMHVRFSHLPRENKYIAKADQLCNDTLDDHG